MVRLKKIEKYIHIHSTIITNPYIIKNWNCRYFVLICLESNNDARKVRDSKKLTIITVIFRCHIIVTSYNSWFFIYSLIHLSIIRKEGIFLKIFDYFFNPTDEHFDAKFLFRKKLSILDVGKLNIIWLIQNFFLTQIKNFLNCNKYR